MMQYNTGFHTLAKILPSGTAFKKLLDFGKRS